LKKKKKKKKKKGKKKSKTERYEDKGLCSVMELRRRASLDREKKMKRGRRKCT
jgi:hypothetical protein